MNYKVQSEANIDYDIATRCENQNTSHVCNMSWLLEAESKDELQEKNVKE